MSQWVNPFGENSLLLKKLDVPLGQNHHPGSYGFKRTHHTHEGVDLYAPVGTPVFAVEDGVVTKVALFTGDNETQTPWWEETWAVWVEGETGTVLYGEIQPNSNVFPGKRVQAGDELGIVLRVLKHDKGRPTSMLHLELHEPGSLESPEWTCHEEKPSVLRDPTPFLLTVINRL